MPPPVASLNESQIVPPFIELRAYWRARRGNPFTNAQFYIDPRYVNEIESSLPESSSDAVAWKKVEAYPTAVWLSSAALVGTVPKTLDDAAAQQKKTGMPVVTVFAIYDVPERDCSAVASNGEFTVANGGEKRYQTEFIDKIAKAFADHPGQRIVAVVEPDSLPNLVTNLGTPKCAAAEQAYRHSITYALKTLAMPHVSLYVDAAHAGWLGGERDRTNMVKLVSEVLAEAGGPDTVRGFATNVSNYDTLYGGDLAQSQSCADELTYVRLFAHSLAQAGITGKGFVIDTGRNGRAGIRKRAHAAMWCNVEGAGLGERPQASPAPFVDAYYWIKPPGESDGGSDSSKPGFDEQCGPNSPNSLQEAPAAGRWFGRYFADLVKNASPPL